MTDLPLRQIIQGDNVEVLKTFPDNCIDLTVTSPPYDKMRDYKGFSFDFDGLAKELLRVTKTGGVVVWVVDNQVIDGDETDTAERQIIRFKELGWRKHDTMIYANEGQFKEKSRYSQDWEYMVILSKGTPKTANIITDVMTKHHSTTKRKFTIRQKDGSCMPTTMDRTRRFHNRSNIWLYDNAYMKGTKDMIAYEHPATFPEELAEDHLTTWSNEGDIILDPFAGSGTTLKAAEKLNRKWVGIEISKEYIEIANKRLAPLMGQQRLI